MKKIILVTSVLLVILVTLLWAQPIQPTWPFLVEHRPTGRHKPIQVSSPTGVGYIDIYEDPTDGTNYTRIQAQAQAGNVIYTLPAADGTIGQVLKTNGAGSLDWTTPAGAGDMLAATYDTDTDGDIDVAAGGTEKSSWTLYCIPYLSGTTTFGEIPIGTAGQYLKVNGTTDGYEWGTIAGGGDVTGPGSSTDHAVARFDGAGGKTLQNSVVIIDDAGTVNIPTGQHYQINSVNLTYSDVGAEPAGVAAADITDASANGRSLITAADYAAMKVLLNLVIGTNVQAYDATLLDIADGAIAENLVNTANPWADNEVDDGITLTNITQVTTRPITSLTATNWRLFYSAGGAVPVELALGADGTFLESNGAAAAPAFRALLAADIPDISATYEPQLVNSAGLLAALNDETGTGVAVFSNSPTLVTPALGTPSALVGTNISGTAASLTAGKATILETARTIAGVAFNGSANIDIASTGLSDTADLLYETELDTFAKLDAQIADKALVNKADGAVWLGTHDYGGADVEMPQATPAVPGVDGGYEYDPTDGTLVIQNSAAHAELSASTDVVIGKLIHSFAATLAFPDLLQAEIDNWMFKTIKASEFPHGIVITEITLTVASDTNYTVDVENWDDFDTINAVDGLIDSVAYTADTTGEVTEDTITYSTIAAGQIIMLDLPTTNVPWINVDVQYYEPAA